MSNANASAPAVATPAKSPSGKKTATKGGAKKPKLKPSYPPTGEMVNSAIAGFKERGGFSLQAIKKYIAAHYKVDSEKLAPFIKKYFKSAVASGALAQPKGKGATGSFKIAVKGKGKTAATKKPKTTKTAPKPAEGAAAKKTTAKAAKSPTKAKKATKPPTKKPKSPKPQKSSCEEN